MPLAQLEFVVEVKLEKAGKKKGLLHFKLFQLTLGSLLPVPYFCGGGLSLTLGNRN